MTICLLSMAVIWILDYQRKSDDMDNGTRDVPELPNNTSFTFNPYDTSMTTRSKPRRMTTTMRPRGEERLSTARHLVTTTVSPHSKTTSPRPIGRPNDCSGKFMKRMQCSVPLFINYDIRSDKLNFLLRFLFSCSWLHPTSFSTVPLILFLEDFPNFQNAWFEIKTDLTGNNAVVC